MFAGPAGVPDGKLYGRWYVLFEVAWIPELIDAGGMPAAFVECICAGRQGSDSRPRERSVRGRTYRRRDHLAAKRRERGIRRARAIFHQQFRTRDIHGG